jgi:hypothetical protein
VKSRMIEPAIIGTRALDRHGNLDFGHSGRGSELIQQDLPILRGQYVRLGLIH